MGFESTKEEDDRTAPTSTLTHIDIANVDVNVDNSKDKEDSGNNERSIELSQLQDTNIDDDDMTTIEIDANWLNGLDEMQHPSPLASPYTSSRSHYNGPLPVVENGITASTVSSFKLICTSDLDLPIPQSLRLSQKRSYIAYRSFFFLYWLVFVASIEFFVYTEKAYHQAFISGEAETSEEEIAYRLSPSYCTNYLILLYSFLALIVSIKSSCTFCNYLTCYCHNLATVFSIFLTFIYWMSVAFGIQQNIGGSLNDSTTFMIANFYGVNAFFMITELTICKYPIPKQRMWISMLISTIYLISVLLYEKFFHDNPIYKYFSVEKPITSCALGGFLVFIMLPMIHYLCGRYEMYFYGLYVRSEYERARNFTFDRKSIQRPESKKYLSSRRLSIEALLSDLDDLDIGEEDLDFEANNNERQKESLAISQH